jgi:hypothetical protein
MKTKDELKAAIEKWKTFDGPVGPLYIELGWTPEQYLHWKATNQTPEIRFEAAVLSQARETFPFEGKTDAEVLAAVRNYLDRSVTQPCHSLLDTLNRERRQAADQAFETAELDGEVCDTRGWEYTETSVEIPSGEINDPDPTWTRTYFVREEAEQDSRTRSFTVRFKYRTAEVELAE